MESITSICGCTSLACKSTASRSVAVITSSAPPGLPSLRARIAVCASDSSPDTYKTLMPPALKRIPASKSMVDLPMPGSPPRSTRLPGTSPPPSTLSNSLMPVLSRSTSVSITLSSVLGLGASFGIKKLCCGPETGVSSSSARLSHVPHSGQRPIHLAVV